MNDLSTLEPLQIYYVANKNTDKSFLNLLTEYLSDYFKIETHFILINKIKELKNKKIDFLFVHQNNLEFNAKKLFNWDFYSKMRKINQSFKLIWILSEFSTNDYEFLKNGADDIFYLDKNDVFSRWKAISLLRRRWDNYSNGNVVIHRGLIMDFLKTSAFLNGKPLHLTKKEFNILSYLIRNRNKGIIPKNEIFKHVWMIDDNDSTRVVDQILLKLRTKLGSEYFQTNFKEGVRLI